MSTLQDWHLSNKPKTCYIWISGNAILIATHFFPPSLPFFICFCSVRPSYYLLNSSANKTRFIVCISLADRLFVFIRTISLTAWTNWLNFSSSNKRTSCKWDRSDKKVVLVGRCNIIRCVVVWWNVNICCVVVCVMWNDVICRCSIRYDMMWYDALRCVVSSSNKVIIFLISSVRRDEWWHVVISNHGTRSVVHVFTDKPIPDIKSVILFSAIPSIQKSGGRPLIS